VNLLWYDTVGCSMLIGAIIGVNVLQVPWQRFGD
jgi:hypothetical protein